MLRTGSMRTKGKKYRLYNCRRCAVQVLICRDCDRGNIYCAGECAQISRLESLRRAAKCYLLGVRISKSVARIALAAAAETKVY